MNPARIRDEQALKYVDECAKEIYYRLENAYRRIGIAEAAVGITAHDLAKAQKALDKIIELREGMEVVEGGDESKD